MKEVTTVLTVELTFIGETEEVKELSENEKRMVEICLKQSIGCDCVVIIKEQDFEGEELPDVPK